MQQIRDRIMNQVAHITPLDEQEAADQSDTSAWVASGADLFRIQKPAVPFRHLVSYFAVVDPEAGTMLLQDHLLAKAWLPPGGHVDYGEDPVQTVRRECREELGISAEFLGEPWPHFVTVTKTKGHGEHIDTSLWFVLQANQTMPLAIEPGKFAGVKWWGLHDILNTPIETFDPQLHRFVRKLQTFLL